MERSSAIRFILLCAVLGCGCVETDRYVYMPAEQATATVAGRSAARYEIPPEAPEGDVRIASFGITDLEGEGVPKIAAVHVRMVLANERGQAPWTLDTRQVVLDLPGEGRSRAAYVNTDVPGFPVVSIPPGRERTLDFYYPLPKGIDKPEDLSRFSLVWRVDTDRGTFAERTPFDRLEIAPPPAPYAGFGVGFGPHWWYDPFYPSFTFAHPVIIVHQHLPPPHRVIVRGVR